MWHSKAQELTDEMIIGQEKNKNIHEIELKILKILLNYFAQKTKNPETMVHKKVF